METVHAGELEVLGEAECRALLAANRVGRIAIVVDNQPAIFPVNYVFDDHSIVFHTNRPILAMRPSRCSPS
jgi:nitroimidazol reductase NimA-like FMN-containing flavoprotein (pyridoxamine 5'-phosphate oxidase superfamily)